MELTTTCRNCSKNETDNNKGIYFIPSECQYFKYEQYLLSKKNRPIESNKVIYYCNECYIDNTLKTTNVKCLHCNVYSDLRDTIKIYDNIIMWKDEFDDMDYFIDEDKNTCDNENLIWINKKGFLCSACFDYLMMKNIIKKIARQPTIDTTCHLCNKNWNPDDKRDYPDDKYLGAIERIYHWNKFFNGNKYRSSYNRYFRTDIEVKSNQYPVDVCNECVNKMSSRDMVDVKCDVCDKTFESYFGCFDQADSCCGHINEFRIRCGYGSRYDYMGSDEDFVWCNGVMPSKLKNKNNICDDCIDVLLENKIIKAKHKHTSYSIE